MKELTQRQTNSEKIIYETIFLQIWTLKKIKIVLKVRNLYLSHMYFYFLHFLLVSVQGASIIRMLHGYIGNDAFRSGMKEYLTKFSYKNTETPDLWACLEDASKKPVGKLMTTWWAKYTLSWILLLFKFRVYQFNDKN